MTKGFYSYLKDAWKKPDINELRKRLVEWRSQNAVTRIEKPTRLDKARAIGYKAKPGFVIVRVRLLRGGRKRPRVNSGRKSKRQTIRKTLMMNYQAVAEQRAARKYKTLEVLNSYWVGKDGIYYFFEVILVDPNHPQIKNDPVLKWIVEKQKGRAFRGLTSAGTKGRGLHQKGMRRIF